jgi:peroxiredoxin Q/BCP
MAVTAGDHAPSFSLEGTQDGVRRTYTLEEFGGRPVVLIFYPGDNTPVCTEQLNSYTDDIDQFLALDA